MFITWSFLSKSWQSDAKAKTEGRKQQIQPACFSLGIQLPSEKVFNLLKTHQTTFLEGIWIPGVLKVDVFLTPPEDAKGSRLGFLWDLRLEA